MKVRVLFFGMLRDIAGRGEDVWEGAAAATLADLFDAYAARFPALGAARHSIVLSLNQDFADRGQALRDNDEVAFLPPVSGGIDRFKEQITDPGGSFYAITEQPIDLPELQRRVLRGSDGALVHFEGVVRNNTRGRRTLYLDYECYAAMAVKVMAQIGRDLVASHEIGRIVMVHRIGRMNIGEASVVISVAAPHRGPAFAAAQEGIHRLKKLVPIWKKEHFADGEVWVEGDWDASVAPR